MSSSSARGSGSLSPAAAASAPKVEDTSGHWARHGAVLTGCIVGINVLIILLVIFFFWRFFSRGARWPSASAGGADDDDDASSSESLPVASPWASRRRREDHHHPAKAAPPMDDVVSALPVYVYSSAGGADADDEGAAGPGKSPECAVCIVELRDGDSARLLPRCGHRFHADCVGAWLRLHATCPLCRASVVAPKAAAATGESRNAKDDDDVGADCPV